jgi:hypothetical protein
MPRDGSNVYGLPFPAVVAGTTISSGVYNGFTNDVALDLNTPRPIVAGGTAATSADAALFNLSAAKAAQLVTNYDAHVWIPGTFYSATNATGEPVDGHAFSGIAYIGEALANPPTNLNVTLEARDTSDGKLYIRRKVAGSWGSWTLDADPASVNAAIALKVDKAGDTMTGMLVLPATTPTLGTHATNKTYVDAADALKANANNAALTGNPTAPNPPGGDNDTSIATTAFITSVAVRYDMVQSLTAGQRAQARTNISAVLQGYLFGLTTSWSSGTVFGVAAGQAADSTGVDLLVLGSAYTKTTGAWAVGSGNGAMDTGTVPAASWVYVFIIKRNDTGVTDLLISLSATAPTLPANYNTFRRIGAMKTVASALVKFFQSGDEFLWDIPIADQINQNPGAGTLLGLTIPPAIMVDAIFHITFNASAVAATAIIHSPLVLNQISGGVSSNFQLATQISGIIASSVMRMLTNTGQLRAVVGGGGTPQLSLVTHGWNERRGKDT